MTRLWADNLMTYWQNSSSGCSDQSNHLPDSLRLYVCVFIGGRGGECGEWAGGASPGGHQGPNGSSGEHFPHSVSAGDVIQLTADPQLHQPTGWRLYITLHADTLYC